MTKYTYAERVVKKVRKFINTTEIRTEFRDAIASITPLVSLNEKYCLTYLKWECYGDILYVTNKYIEYQREYGNSAIILRYNNFDELLNISF